MSVRRRDLRRDAVRRPPARIGITLGSLCCLLLTLRAEAVEIDQGLSPVLHSSTLVSVESTYEFIAPGVSWGLSAGHRINFVSRLTAFFPAALFQDGHYFHARDYYDPIVGGEALLGAGVALALPDDQRAALGLGAHLNGQKLGSARYETFYSLTLGVGIDARYRYPLSRSLAMGAFIASAVHFMDFIHDADGLRYGVFICGGITLALRTGR